MVTVAVEVAIAGWFASTIISRLIDKASSYFKDQKEWQSGMKDEVNRLSDYQLKIKTLVEAAERGDRQVADNLALKEWLGKLRDAVEEADIVFDEMEYQRLKAKADGHPAVKQDDVLKRLREVVKTFDNLVEGLRTIAEVLKWLDKPIATEVSGDDGRETSFLFTENEFIGRESEKQTVIQWLKKSDEKVSVFSIVGVGGVGKTALVQNIFDHPGLDFKIKMWVCVSTSFEEKVIINNMLWSLTKTKHEFPTLDAAHSTLMKKITGKKFLLVLDDVWNDKEREKWKKVMAPLKCGSEGSKILVTTRMESVADTVAKVVGQAMISLNLIGLGLTDNLELFEKYAFAGLDPNEYPQLQSIGKNIALKLMGIPLVVKTVGGMLNNKLDVKYWRKVLQDGALNSDKGTDGIMAAIRLTYENLPPDLKPCFRYCSIFPQDYMFKREQLVDMWISVGLIPGDEKGQEELANEYFETLVRKSFFEPKFSYFNMHDLLHDLAQVLSKNECLQIVSNDPEIQIPQSIRHLSITTNNILVLKNLSKLKYLRTLLLSCDVEDAESVGVNIGTALKRLKTIRYLKLSSKWLCDFPKSIGDLVHLRCLRIERTNISKLSPCIGTLYHLQILELTINPSHPSEQSIPANIYKLSKLKRLDLPEDAISTIPHIGKLSSLQKLIGYSVKSEVGYDISELEMMSELRELMITNLENVKSPEEARNAQLNSKQHLLSIALKWGHDQNIGGMNETEKVVADCLQPHKNLTNLLLKGYRATNLPKWLTPQFLPYLTTMNLAQCDSLERLPPFGQLPYLKFLILNRMGALKEISSEFYGSSQSDNIFPALEKLTLMYLVKLEEWREDTQSKQLFPRLKLLEIDNCKSLKKLPPIPTALKELRLYNLEIETLPVFKQKNEESSTNQGQGSLFSLHIFTCSNLTSLKSGFFMHPEELASLVVLKIQWCHNLVHLPSNGFRELTSLKSLSIENCGGLILLPMLLPTNFFPPSVQRLVLNSCGDLAACLTQLLQDLSLLSFLKLDNCDKLISLPSVNVLQSLTSLKEIEIQNCRGLKSLGGLEAISSLKVLMISSCPWLGRLALHSIEQSPGNELSMALDRLEIYKPEVLHSVPLRILHFTKSLEIRDYKGFQSIEKWFKQTEASLQSLVIYCDNSSYHDTLPLFQSLKNFQRLRVFKLHKVYMRYITFNSFELPRSLEILEIDECCYWFAKSLMEGGDNYDKISHINVVKLRVKKEDYI